MLVPKTTDGDKQFVKQLTNKQNTNLQKCDIFASVSAANLLKSTFHP